MNSYSPDSSDSSPKRELPDVLHHYLGLFRRKLPFLLILGPLVTIAGIAGLTPFDMLGQKLPATVLIGMDKPLLVETPNAWEDLGPKKIELIRNRNFLQDVVVDLGLRLGTAGRQRNELFDSVRVGQNAEPGAYQLRKEAKDSGFVVVTRLNGWFGAKSRIVFRKKAEGLKTVEFSDVYLKLNDALLKNTCKIKFTIRTGRQAVDNLLQNMTIERPSSRRENYFTITLTGRDYSLTTQTVNAIADMFVRQNLSYGKNRSREKLGLLNNQMELAKKKLSASEDALRGFLGANPSFALDKQTERTVSELLQRETKGVELENLLNDARILLQQLQSAKNENLTDIVHEILILLASKNNIRASVLQSELTRLVSEKGILDRNYSKDHPLVRLNRQKMDAIVTQASLALNDFILDLTQSLAKKKDNIGNLSDKLRYLPQKSFQLAEFRRVQQVDSESYALLMSRYNEARVGDDRLERGRERRR